MQDKKGRFEDILKDGIEQYLLSIGIKNFNSANNINLGKGLAIFYLKEIGQYMYPFIEDDIEEGFVDSSKDCGIDFIFNRDKEWLIFQFKYKGGNNSLTTDELSGFFKVHSAINDKDYLSKFCNSKINDALIDFKNDHSVQYIFVTNAKLGPKNHEDFKQLQREYEPRYENVTYDLKGLTEIKLDHNSALSNNETISDNITIHIETLTDTFTGIDKGAYFDLSSVIDKEGKYKSVLCTIKGTTLRSLWEHHKARLFNYNIRGFLGDNAINKKMKETIDTEPDKFYFYNNGISAICTDLQAIFNGKNEITSFQCSNLSIINGAQTTTTIGRYRNSTNLQQVRVLLKITKAEDYKKEKGLNRKIITYNNSQTVIKVSDFRSNDAIQLFLDSKLSNYSFNGSVPYKKIRYLRKRLKVTKNKLLLDVTMEALARALYVFDNEPVLIFQGPNALFDPETEKGGKYWITFGQDGEEVTAYDTKRLERTVAIYFIWYILDEKIKALIKSYKAQKDESPKYRALIAKWHFLWAYGFILQKFYPNEFEGICKRISSGRLFEEKNNFVDNWFEKVHNTISKCLAKKYQLSSTTKGSDARSFDFKNWLRNTAEFEELKIEFEYMSKSDFLI